MKTYFEQILEEAKENGYIEKTIYEEFGEETIAKLNENVDKMIRNANDLECKSNLSAEKLIFNA